MSFAAPEPARGIFSIGAVASMLDLPPATLRTWEERYATVSPSRTPAGQRLYSRQQVEQLRFITAEMGRGCPPQTPTGCSPTRFGTSEARTNRRGPRLPAS